MTVWFWAGLIPFSMLATIASQREQVSRTPDRVYTTVELLDMLDEYRAAVEAGVAITNALFGGNQEQKH